MVICKRRTTYHDELFAFQKRGQVLRAPPPPPPPLHPPAAEAPQLWHESLQIIAIRRQVKSIKEVTRTGLTSCLLCTLLRLLGLGQFGKLLQLRRSEFGNAVTGTSGASGGCHAEDRDKKEGKEGDETHLQRRHCFKGLAARVMEISWGKRVLHASKLVNSFMRWRSHTFHVQLHP